ncbi:hypothetical protein IEQ34_000509 [Dendrobium chrysotoxum]|uniref:Uncharacterized protein n=1 Tax=Dendrobium chrysotoxum TaxID=161865 RepID=A0AAV7HPB0_DENCH|nr:hypothetical protein IEQ34_000509 [Dendrobium chrysotoxum]
MACHEGWHVQIRSSYLLLSKLVGVCRSNGARLEVGGGMLLLAALRLAVLASLLPNFTFQFGPPSLFNQAFIFHYQ